MTPTTCWLQRKLQSSKFRLAIVKGRLPRFIKTRLPRLSVEPKYLPSMFL
jgi:hypothetical protein